MNKSLMSLIFAAPLCLLAQPETAPNHIFDPKAPLTAGSGGAPADIALDFIRARAQGHKLTEPDLESIYISREYRTVHNGVTHVTLSQRFGGVDVANSEFVVNISRLGEVINAGGKLFPLPTGEAPNLTEAAVAVQSAAAEVNPAAAQAFTAAQTIPYGSAKGIRFARGPFAEDIAGRAVWFGATQGVFAAWRFEIADPATGIAWAVIVDSHTQRVLAKEPLTLRQTAGTPRGLVFERGSPQPNPRPGHAITEPPPRVNRTLQPFTGDPIASPAGWVVNNQTAGNNVVAGANALGTECLPGRSTPCQTRPEPVTAPNGDFSFPLELGLNAANPTAYFPAATTNLFYWVNRTHDFLYGLGFDEAAGNFQERNFGRGGAENDAMYAYVQAATRAPDEAIIDNANFGGIRVEEDGARPRMAMYLWTLGGTWLDASLDADVIVHEYAHGLTARLVRRLYGTYQGRAMGEGWSDFFAMELLTPEGAPADGVYQGAAYVTQRFSSGDRTRPYSTNFEINPLTFANYARVTTGPEEHADGEIWVEALWEVRAALIRQHGEREGRRRLRLIAVDSLKLSVPAPSMIDARDAILLADRVNFNGASQDQIWAAFARRGLGALAQSYGSHSVHVSPDFTAPSRMASLRFYNDRYTIGEFVRVVLQDANQRADRVQVQLTGSSGDIENLQMRRTGSAYYGSIGLTYAPVARGDGALNLVPGDSVTAYHTDFDTGGAPAQVTFTAPVQPDYFFNIAAPQFRFEGERALGLRTGFGRIIRVLPFDFPFFGKTYRSVNVYNNGILTFELPDFSPCSDVGSLHLTKGIAPMWMALRTDGIAQPNEDVYVSETNDAVTFRWAAETSRDFMLPGVTAPADPVNFAARLHRNGRIEFFYGTGNKNLVSGSQFFNCPAAAPTVGISSGEESFAQLAITHDSQGSLENAPRIVFDPPSPLGGPTAILEAPVSGDTVKGILRGRGIVHDSQADVLIRRVDVLVDGIARTTAQFVNRADFCRATPVSGCPFVGFTFTLDTAALGLAPGVHRLQLRATSSRGAVTQFPEQPVEITVEAAETQVYARIEVPEEGAEVSGRTPVTGYVALSDARVSIIEVIVDGINFGIGGYGITRAAVCAELPPNTPGCPRIGFSVNLTTTEQNLGSFPLSNGPHTLQIRARDEFGRYHIFPPAPVRFTVNNEANESPRGVLTSPSPNERVRGVMAIRGHAWDPDGRVERVRVFIDDILYAATAPIRYGDPRPEACTALQNVAACPNIGFEGEFDTRRLANGLHSLRVIITDDKGRNTDVPNVLSGGVNFFVEN